MDRSARDRDRPWWPRRSAFGLACVTALVVLVAACGAHGHEHPASSSTSASATRTTTRAASHPTPDRTWLGLNSNSSAGTGSLTEFSRVGVAWDRSGNLETADGFTPQTVTQLGDALRRSLGAGMIPDVLVDPLEGPRGCTTNPNRSGVCVPLTPAQVNAYAAGFVKTVVATRRLYPSRLIVFEPMDEPWDWAFPPGSSSGRRAAADYAAVLARMLPALRAAGVPLTSIYVPATGTLGDGSEWITDLYRAQPCLAPGPHSCGPIEAWNAHVYGTPYSSSSSLGVVSGLRHLMRSGAGNVIVSELGFCATNVEGGQDCDENTPAVDGSSATVSHWLDEVLSIAERQHSDGWLRALILWNRSGGGWSAQLPDGRLTALGETLLQFARRDSR